MLYRLLDRFLFYNRYSSLLLGFPKASCDPVVQLPRKERMTIQKHRIVFIVGKYIYQVRSCLWASYRVLKSLNPFTTGSISSINSIFAIFWDKHDLLVELFALLALLIFVFIFFG